MQDAPCTMDSGMTACRLGYRHETLTVAVNVDRVIITESSSPHPPSAAETMTVMRQRAAKAGLVCREYLPPRDDMAAKPSLDTLRPAGEIEFVHMQIDVAGMSRVSRPGFTAARAR